MNKEWLKYAGIRALKTMAQSFLATVGSSAILSDVDWKVVLSATVLSGILSMVTSIAGIPEVKSNEQD